MRPIRADASAALSQVKTSELQLSFDPAADRAKFREAVQTLADRFGEFDGWFEDGTMDMNELYACSRGDKGPELQAAAKFIISRPKYLDELDTARDGGSIDGKVSLGDAQAQLGKLDRELALDTLRYDPRLGEFQRTVSVLAQYWAQVDVAGGGLFGADGRVSQKDLDAINANASTPAELRQAALFLSTNQDLLGMLDTAAKGGSRDGVVSTEDLHALSDKLMDLRSALPIPATLRQVTYR